MTVTGVTVSDRVTRDLRDCSLLAGPRAGSGSQCQPEWQLFRIPADSEVPAAAVTACAGPGGAVSGSLSPAVSSCRGLCAATCVTSLSSFQVSSCELGPAGGVQVWGADSDPGLTAQRGPDSKLAGMPRCKFDTVTQAQPRRPRLNSDPKVSGIRVSQPPDGPGNVPGGTVKAEATVTESTSEHPRAVPVALRHSESQPESSQSPVAALDAPTRPCLQ